ncbi:MULTISPECIES: hypothetical protein [Mycolicibacterium]|uniref:hypothetical protein n=1 Tax=Mycolicibacterium TaxID=1866885 RepID=UPI00114F8FC4|nr:hypothetical protein [Mycolicibacterium mageritense]MBN3455060.1 hypothetical protein [Mycobacterium sp. DSM 3803]TXI63200.1 MAG: hypothetical protein E6Q55_10115 [Mycolicibacterium mageritense]
MVSDVAEDLQNGPGGRDAILAAADRATAMSKKLRSSVDSVSTPSIKEQLGNWADGANLGAESQRISANENAPSSNSFAPYAEASVKVHDATAALREQCPNMPLPPPQP